MESGEQGAVGDGGGAVAAEGFDAAGESAAAGEVVGFEGLVAAHLAGEFGLAEQVGVIEGE